MGNVKLKDPNAVLDYTINWATSYLSSTGETISTSAWSVTPSTSQLLIQSSTKTTTTTTVWLTGGTKGFVYRATNRVVTNMSRTEDRSVVIRVASR